MAMEDTLRSIMSERLIAVGADEPALAAIRKMVEKDVGAVLVKRGNRIMGILTERDILRAATKKEGVLALRVREITSRRRLVTAKPDDPPLHALRLMAQHQVRRIPVVEKGRVVGIVTERDLVTWLLRRPEVILDLLSMDHPAVSRDALVALLTELRLREQI